MKKAHLFCLILLFTTTFSFGQTTNWRHHVPDGLPQNHPQAHLAAILESENNIIVFKQHLGAGISYYGESTPPFIDFQSISSSCSISNISKKNINNEDFYIVTTVENDVVSFNVTSMQGIVIGDKLDFYQSTNSIDNALISEKIKICLVEEENGNFVLFGRDSIYNFNLHDNYTWEVSNYTSHNFGDISSSIKVGDNYFITTVAGKAILLSETFNIIWETDTGVPLQTGIKSSTGYVLCGNVGNWSAHIIKIDNNGTLQWHETYEDRRVFDVLPVDEGFLVAGLSGLFRIDEDGNILWERIIFQKYATIYKIQKSQYGSILILDNRYQVYEFNLNSDDIISRSDILAVNNVGGYFLPWGDMKFLNAPLEEYASIGTIHGDVPAFVGQTESGILKGFYEHFTSYLDTLDGFKNIPSIYPTTWKIFQKDIDNVQQRLAAGENLAPYSNALLTYPAKGNPNCIVNYNDTVTIDNDLAPFIDVNGDGIYNMFDGDYPEMKGDVMIWWARKQASSDIEIHGRWYAYDCGNHVVSNTLYAEYKLINRSINNYPVSFFGKITQFRLGCDIDDYIGSLPQVNAIFSYNADEFDEFFDNSCASSYDDDIPIQSMIALGQGMGAAMYYNSDGDDFPEDVTDITSLENAFNQFQGIYNDGTPLTSGGNGYNPGSIDYTKFVFPGNPANPNEWSMQSENTSVDIQHMITSTNAFSLPSGESKTFTFAYTTHPSILYPAPDITPIVEDIQQVTDIHDNGNAFAQVFLGQDQAITAGETITLNAGDDGLEYIWSTNEDGASIQVSAPGTYAVTVIDETGCQRSDEITINQATGIADVEITQLAVYPNPTKSGTNISIELPAMEEISMVKLFNIVGKEVYSEKLMIQTQQVDVKLSDAFSSGIYIVQLTSVDGKVMVGKVVIE